jgi:hypothetical protein
VQDHEVVLLGGLVDLEAQSGERAAEPLGRGEEPGRAGLAAGGSKAASRLTACGWKTRSKSSRLPVAMRSML